MIGRLVRWWAVRTFGIASVDPAAALNAVTLALRDEEGRHGQ